MTNKNLLLPVLVFIIGVMACSKKANACRIVEKAESRILSIYESADMKFSGFSGDKSVSEKALEWKAEMESIRRQDDGDVETISGFVKWLEANAFMERKKVDYLRVMINEMRTGNQVPEEGQIVIPLVGLPRDGKTKEERVLIYKLRAERYEKMVTARAESAAIFQATADQLKQLVK